MLFLFPLSQISFHRPHSPYDPPERLLKQTLQRKLPEMVVSTDGWDDMFRGGPGDPPGCGPSNNDAWCGLMPANESAVSRAAYFASVQFVDEQVGTAHCFWGGSGGGGWGAGSVQMPLLACNDGSGWLLAVVRARRLG